MRHINVALLASVPAGYLIASFAPTAPLPGRAIASASMIAPPSAETTEAATVTLGQMLVGGVDSVLMVAVGHSEGTRTADGGKTSAWTGHVDPGNAAWNKGTCSWQVGGADTPEQADQLCIERIRSMVPNLLQETGASSPLIIAAIADSAVQAPKAAKDFPKRYRECKQQNQSEFETVVCARVQSFRDPATGEFDAPGLREVGIENDQRRRLSAIARVLDSYGGAGK